MNKVAEIKQLLVHCVLKNKNSIYNLFNRKKMKQFIIADNSPSLTIYAGRTNPRVISD